MKPHPPPHGAEQTGMPGPVRARMERTLGADFSDVRVRVESARALELQAQAFTQGNEIHVAPGCWAPETARGRWLLGHELGHVLQQRAGLVRPGKHPAGVGLNDDPALEREADALGARAADATGAESRAAGCVAAPPLTAPLARLVTSKSATTIQRVPLDMGQSLHGSLLDQYSRETGTPRDRAAAHDPAYAAWLSVRRLDRLTVDELLATLTELQERGRLATLIASANPILASRYARVMTAMDVVRESRGPGANPATALATIAASGLPAAEQLAMSHFVRVPTARTPDQRAAIAPGGAAALPTADLVREIGYELDPSSRPSPTPPPPPSPPGAPAPPPPPPPARIPWDGRTGAPGAAAARATMQSELFKAYDEYLKHSRANTLAALARPRVAFTAPAAAPGGAAPAATGVVDIANQARAELERRYATSMNAAATTPTQVAARGPRQASAPGQNIFDASSEADRQTLTGTPDLAPGVAWWLFENDRPGAEGAPGSRTFASDVLAAHRYSTQDPGATQFRWDVANAYGASATLPAPGNKRWLIEYRMTHWSEADPGSGRRGFTVQSSFNPAGDRNRLELVKRWQIFHTAAHESLHLRTHPAFEAADQGRGTMREGFVEMFTIATLNADVLPRARAGTAEPLRRTVEGALSPAAADPAIIISRTTPVQYAAHRAQAERIRDGGTPAGGTAHAGVGEAAVRAAFFQGHVEYLGLGPTGSQLPTLRATGVPAQVSVPPAIRGLDDLAWRSGVPRATIERDNPGITDALPATAVLAGCREHWVVSGETRAMIAAQNGVTETDLVRANPDVALHATTSDWAALPAGRRILIPVH